MGIVTRTGDKGETSLADGQRIKKHDPLIDAYGIVDELNSWIGLIRASAEKQFDPLDERLARIQRDCFVLGAHLATPSHPKSTRYLPEIGRAHV